MQKYILSRGHYLEKNRSKNEDVSSDNEESFLITFPLKIMTGIDNLNLIR